MECLLGMTQGYTSSSSNSKPAVKHSSKNAQKYSSSSGSSVKQHGKLHTDGSCSQIGSHCGSAADACSSRVSSGCEAASTAGIKSPGSTTGAKQTGGQNGTAAKGASSSAATGSSASSAGQAAAATVATAAAAGQCGSAGLARLLDELRLYPTCAQLHLMDKKFGGGWGVHGLLRLPMFDLDDKAGQHQGIRRSAAVITLQQIWHTDAFNEQEVWMRSWVQSTPT
jgi:hypothetical protein